MINEQIFNPLTTTNVKNLKSKNKRKSLKFGMVKLIVKSLMNYHNFVSHDGSIT